jgi:hypothetical protein
MPTTFKKLNKGWNAEPNAPHPKVEVKGTDVLLIFYLNHQLFAQFKEEQIGILRFHNCSRYRLGPTNDEGWYKSQCRFSKLAPAWGEFYEVSGDLLLNRSPNDWFEIGVDAGKRKHFLFYLRDNQFEADAGSWTFEY